MSEEDDDRVAQEVGRMMAEQDGGLDPELEAYARGVLAEDQRRALEARAARDPELAQALELFAPLAPAVLVRVAQAAGPEPVRAPLRAIAGDPARDRAPSRRPHRARRAPIFAGALVAMAASVAVGLWVSAPAPLPAFTLAARAGDAQWRGASETGTQLRADSELELTLVPATPVHGALEGKLLVLRGDTVVDRGPATEVSSDGALRWRGPAGSLLGVDAGSVTVVLVAARPGQWPRTLPPTDPSFPHARIQLTVEPLPPR